MGKAKTFVIAEVGINHNGDINIAKKLIDAAVFAGCDAVKFQKRDILTVYSKEELEKPRESPWGKTNGQQKYGLEFSFEEYEEIDKYCYEKNIPWFASAWDIKSLEFLKSFNLPYNKIASAMIGHEEFINEVAKEGKKTFISTGMSEMEEIENIVDIFEDRKCPFELMHCVGTYPMKVEDANLKLIPELKKKFTCWVGYSGHESGLMVSCAAVTLGATSIERHITLDRTMYGSDQAASVEPMGMFRLVKSIRTIEKSLGGIVKEVSEAEAVVREKLRYYEK